MTLRGKILIGLAVAIAATAAVAIVFFSNPLQKSNEALRAYLLQKVPLGSSLENLQAVAAREGWEFAGTSKSQQPDGTWTTSAWVVLGEYESKEVDAHWQFNDRGLIDLWIGRENWQQLTPARKAGAGGA